MASHACIFVSKQSSYSYTKQLSHISICAYQSHNGQEYCIAVFAGIVAFSGIPVFAGILVFAGIPVFAGILILAGITVFACLQHLNVIIGKRSEPSGRWVENVIFPRMPECGVYN